MDCRKMLWVILGRQLSDLTVGADAHIGPYKQTRRFSAKTDKNVFRQSQRRPYGRLFRSKNKIVTQCQQTVLAPIKKDTQKRVFFIGAGDEARTRYLHLGKVALYRMSYTRISNAGMIIAQIPEKSREKSKFLKKGAAARLRLWVPYFPSARMVRSPETVSAVISHRSAPPEP